MITTWVLLTFAIATGWVADRTSRKSMPFISGLLAGAALVNYLYTRGG